MDSPQAEYRLDVVPTRADWVYIYLGAQQQLKLPPNSEKPGYPPGAAAEHKPPGAPRARLLAVSCGF